MQARYYDPVIGRFYSNDPVDFMGHFSSKGHTMGMNRYSYVRNNPYRFTDPDGRQDMQAFYAMHMKLAKEKGVSQEDHFKKVGTEQIKATNDVLNPGKKVGLLIDVAVSVGDYLLNDESQIDDTIGLATTKGAEKMTELIKDDLGVKSGNPLKDTLLKVTNAVIGKTASALAEPIEDVVDKQLEENEKVQED